MHAERAASTLVFAGPKGVARNVEHERIILDRMSRRTTLRSQEWSKERRQPLGNRRSCLSQNGD